MLRWLDQAGTEWNKRKSFFLYFFLHRLQLLFETSPHQAIFRPLSFIPMEIAFTRGVTGCWLAPLAQLLLESVKRSGSVVFGSQLRICVWAPGDGGAGRNLRSRHCWTDERYRKRTRLPFQSWFPRQSNGFPNCGTERGRLITVLLNTPGFTEDN